MTPSEEVKLTCKSMGEGGQSKLARLLGVNSRTVRRWIAGKTTPGEAMLGRIRGIGNKEMMQDA